MRPLAAESRRMMLGTVVALGDITDVEAFVIYAIGKAKGLVLSEDQRDELICHGFVELVALHNRFDPSKAEVPFSVYANTLLPRRLSNVWNRQMNEHIMNATLPDGTRTTRYYQTPVSWEEKTTYRGETGEFVASAPELDVRTPGEFTKVPEQVTVAA